MKYEQPQQPGFRIIEARFPTIARAEGPLEQTPNLWHHFETQRLTGATALLSPLPFGKRAMGEIYTYERRRENVETWNELLGWHPGLKKGERSRRPTHLIRFGYTVTSHQQRVDIFAFALNFSLPGWDSDSVARSCSESCLRRIQKLTPEYRDQIPYPSRALTQSGYKAQLDWLIWIFFAYREFRLPVPNR